MAAQEPPLRGSQEKRALQVIDLSDSDADPSPSFTLRDASRIATADAAIAGDGKILEQKQEQNGGPVRVSPEEEDFEEFTDTDSFLEDLIGGDADDEEETKYDGEMCTSAESLAFKSRLHLVGVEQFVAETVGAGTVSAKKLITAFGVTPPTCFEGGPDERYLRILGILVMRESLKRAKLPQYNTIEDFVTLLQGAKNVMVITGAGISTNLGIPDFRSEGSGFYSRLRKLGYDDPQMVFDLHVFRDDPSIFYQNCGDTFPKAGVTSPTHAFIALLQEKGKLLRNYTQNIDNIEASAGIKPEKLIQCHGSWGKATCIKCGYKVDGSEIMSHVEAGIVPQCSKCVQDIAQRSQSKKRKRGPTSDGRPSKDKRWTSDEGNSSSEDDSLQPGVMKPDIIFFHEQLPNTFFDTFNDTDKHAVDLVVVIGTSMSVAPVSEIPMALKKDFIGRDVPHVYISNKVCGDHIGFDITLLGDCDTIVGELARRLGWELKHKLLPEDQKVTVTASDKGEAVWAIDKV